MNPLLSAISRHFRRPQRNRGLVRTIHRQPRRQQFCLEALEDRIVLSPTISVANASMNEIGNVSAFVAPGSGGLSSPKDIVLGPDGNVYAVSTGTNSVIRYNGTTGQLMGTFVASGSGGLGNPYGLAFGPDGNLYVGSRAGGGGTNSIYCYNGTTGAYMDTFVSSGSGGLNDPIGIAFGPDGNLYVSSHSTHSVMRYEGPSGPSPGTPLPSAGQTGATFVAQGSGGLNDPQELTFGPDGELYVDDGKLGVLRYDTTTGEFLNIFAAAYDPSGTVDDRGIAFDQDGRMYVADNGTNSIYRFNSQGQYLDTPVVGATSSLQGAIGITFDARGDLLVSSLNSNAIDEYNAGVVVTLSTASSSPLSVNYATSDGTATAGTDYTAQTGTVTFAPGQTSHVISLATLPDPVMDGNETFNVQLSNPTGGATIANGNAVVTIVDPTWPQVSVSNTSAIEGDPTAHYRGAFANDLPYNNFYGVAFGPDGNLYTSPGPSTNTIQRYNGTTGALMGTFVAGPLSAVRDIVFHNGYMYVASENTSQVLYYNATTGAYLGVFVAAGSGGINGCFGMTFGPDGNLYVTGRESNSVVEYNGTTGAYIRTLVTAGSGGLNLPEGLAFDPSGQYLYVASSGSDQVLKYNAQTGAYGGVAASASAGVTDVKFGSDGLLYVLTNSTSRIMRFNENGSYIDDYVPTGSPGMTNAQFMTFGPNGDLYVTATGFPGNNQILQFGTENEALFTVTLSTPLAMPVTVNYATADSTAHAGTNYTASSGTLTFAPGVTSETIRVPILDSGSQTTALTFTVNLSSPQLATLAQSQATGTIEPSDQAAKFYVLNNAGMGNGGNSATFKYQSSGTEQAPFELSQSDNDPISIAANPTGTQEWILDRNGNVYVYSSGGTLLGSWTPGGIPAGDSLNGIATDGTNVWLVDDSSDKIFEYAGAASRLSGSQNTSSSFKLNKSDSLPTGIVTDGKSMWVVDLWNDKVFKYTVAGSLLGSWSIDPADVDPTGITVNPNNPSDIWIVDAYTREVYDYAGAATRTSGKQNASSTFALAAGNTYPVGIADPPTAGVIPTSTASPLALKLPSATAFHAVLPLVQSGPAAVPSLASRDAAFVSLAQMPLQRVGVQRSDGAITLPLDSLTPFADLMGTTASVFGGSNPLEALTLLTSMSSPIVHSDGSVMGLQEGTLAGADKEISAAATALISVGSVNDATAEE